MKLKEFYKYFFSIYIILVLQNVVTISVNLADNMMLGAYNESSLAGVAAINQIQFVYQQVLVALGDGAVIICSQYWGKKDTKPMKRIVALAMQAGLILAVLLFAAVSLFPDKIVSLFTTDAAILQQGVTYLKMIRFSYLFFAITTILLAALRSVEVVRIAFVLSLVTLTVNCGLNSILIYGRFGVPELGVTGAAIGTLCARIIECGIIISYCLLKDKRLGLKISDFFCLDRTLFKDYFKLTFPIVFVQALWGLNTALQTVILGHMTSAAIAANSAASSLFMVVKSAAYGASSASSVIIGKAIGIGNLGLVRKYSSWMQRLFLAIGILGGFTLFLIRIPILSVYKLSPETMSLANSFIIILSIVFVGMAYQMPTNNGIVRGGGNAMFVVKMDLISIWMIVLPLSFFMAFVVKASPLVVVCCLNADQIFKCVPAFLESHYGNWIRKLTR